MCLESLYGDISIDDLSSNQYFTLFLPVVPDLVTASVAKSLDIQPSDALNVCQCVATLYTYYRIRSDKLTHFPPPISPVIDLPGCSHYDRAV